MERRWTQEAVADLEHIADYLFEHTPEHAARLARALYDGPRVADIPEPRPAVYVVRILHGAQQWP